MIISSTDRALINKQYSPNYKIFDTIMYKNCTKIFHSISYELSKVLFNILENFIIDKKHDYPGNSVYKFHLTEQMILKNNLNEILDINTIYSFQNDSLRVFVIPTKTDKKKRYLISEFDEFSEVNEKYNHYYSIFIYENFFTDDKYDYLHFLYELAERIIGYNLYKEGVPVNIIKGIPIIIVNAERKSVNPKYEIDPNTAKFIVDYYTTLFKFIISHINIKKVGIDQISEVLSEKFLLFYYNAKCIDKIFEYAKACVENRDNDNMYYDLCNEVYNSFLN